MFNRKKFSQQYWERVPLRDNILKYKQSVDNHFTAVTWWCSDKSYHTLSFFTFIYYITLAPNHHWSINNTFLLVKCLLFIINSILVLEQICTTLKLHVHVQLVHFIFYWSIIALRCCVGLCCTMRWICYMYMYIPHLNSLPPTPHSTPLGHHTLSFPSACLYLLSLCLHLYSCPALQMKWFICTIFLDYIYLIYDIYAVMCLVAPSCLTLCDPMDYSLPGSSVHGILQARILEWVAMPSSRGSSQPRVQTQVSGIIDRFFTIWATREAPYEIYMIWDIYIYISYHINIPYLCFSF